MYVHSLCIHKRFMLTQKHYYFYSNNLCDYQIKIFGDKYVSHVGHIKLIESLAHMISILLLTKKHAHGVVVCTYF